VADGSLHTGGGGAVLFGYRGVENLGDGIDDVGILYRQKNGCAEVLASLDPATMVSTGLGWGEEAQVEQTADENTDLDW
jgi:hypothetical protein